MEEARRLLRRASRVDPIHLYVWQAWGCLEYRQQNFDTGGGWQGWGRVSARREEGRPRPAAWTWPLARGWQRSTVDTCPAAAGACGGK